MGPGWYEDQYLKTLGKLGDGPLSFVPWYDPNKKLSQALEAALAKKYPEINLNTNHIYTFEALLVAADAYKRAGSTDPKALADAIRATNIKDNVVDRPGHRVQRQGAERQAEEFRDPEPRRQAGDGGAEGRDERQGRMADDALRQARVTPLSFRDGPQAGPGIHDHRRLDLSEAARIVFMDSGLRAARGPGMTAA